MFSIVVPLFNKEKYILRTLRSVLAQTFEQFEVVVVNDGSTDGSASIVKALGDGRIRLLNQQNGGEAAARNAGIRAATQPYIAFLDADDSWAENHLAQLAALAQDFPNGGLYCSGYTFIEPSGRERKPAWHSVPKRGIVLRFFHSVANGDQVATASSVCVPRTVFSEVGYFPLGDRLGADQDMWARIALRYPVVVDSLPTAIYFRDATNRICVSEAHKGELPYSVRLQRLLDEAEVPSEVVCDVAEYIRAGLITLVSINTRAGDVGTAQAVLRDHRLAVAGPRVLFWRAVNAMHPTLRLSCIRCMDVLRGR